MPLRIEALRDGSSKARYEFELVTAIDNVVADVRGFFLVANHKIVSTRKQGRARKRRLRFLMLELAVNYGRHALSGVPIDVFPNIEHGAASRIDDDTALLRQELHLRRRDSKRRNQ